MAQDPGSRLISAIRKQNEKTIYFCTAQNISPNVAVHEIRKSFKRIRALLHFFDEINETGIHNFKTRVKELGRELSVMRESFVNLQLFERELLGNKLIAEQKLKKALEQLDEKNQALIQKKLIAPGRCHEIKQVLEEFNQYIGTPESLPSKLHLFRQIVLSFEKCHQVFTELPAEQPAEEMHELRKKMKRLWYQFDFLRFIHPRFFRMKTDQLNHITEHLGEDHDLYVFLQELKNNPLGFDSEEFEILQNQVMHLREVNLFKLNPRLNQFFTEPPEAFEIKMREIFKVE